MVLSSTDLHIITILIDLIDHFLILVKFIWFSFVNLLYFIIKHLKIATYHTIRAKSIECVFSTTTNFIQVLLLRLKHFLQFVGLINCFFLTNYIFMCVILTFIVEMILYVTSNINQVLSL